MLKITNLKRYFGGVKAVNNASFGVKEKTITALIGPNGSGKTTVFNLISGILKADSGKIFFNDKDITNLKPEIISNIGISRLFQQSRLFNNLTVKENLLLAIDNEDTKFWKNVLGKNKVTKEKEQKVKQILNIVGMGKFENRIARELSYGQKRLIELARVLLNPHNLLMLDEPVAGVTPKLRTEIAKILTNLKKQNETILLIEHDMNFTLKIADHVIVMDNGKVIAEGKPEQIKRNKKVMEAYLGE
ncbi:ABC transporter ATP-binding protein [Candidatus Woesearchaeota archaeon]|nr:ABC transporter ATP-binding protein [Candidatus Woesearchaeota archaeon]MBW3018051.1 ABC transporter ATP-binding protein [Candidatus Woesearchaeota archaeon]